MRAFKRNAGSFHRWTDAVSSTAWHYSFNRVYSVLPRCWNKFSMTLFAVTPPPNCHPALDAGSIQRWILSYNGGIGIPPYLKIKIFGAVHFLSFWRKKKENEPKERKTVTQGVKSVRGFTPEPPSGSYTLLAVTLNLFQGLSNVGY